MPTRRLAIAAASILAVAVLVPMATPPALVADVSGSAIDGDPAAWIDASERRVAAVTPIIAGAEKRVRWFDAAAPARTAYAIVYLHGFSATRQEIAPVGERLADALGANLFETRLSGHGLAEHALADVRAEDWLADAAEALAVGEALGRRTILVGTSTGATLALAMSGSRAARQVAALVLLSPNFAPADHRAEILTWPGGPLLARLLVGPYRSFVPANDAQRRYWSTTYPTAATVEMMRLVRYLRGRLPLAVGVPVLVLYSPSDTVVDVEATRRALARIGSPRLVALEIPSAGDPGQHVIAGDILSPGNNLRVVAETVGFLRESGL